MRVSQISVAAMLTLAFAAGACGRSDVPDPTDRTELALDDANIKNVDVDWDRDARVAHLKGTVDSARERDRAEEVAQTAVGTSGKVLNEVTVAGPNESSADDLDGRIRDVLGDMRDQDPVLRDRDIDFDVNNGVVTVKGNVRTADEKAKVSGMVKSTAGVKDFANTLEVKPH